MFLFLSLLALKYQKFYFASAAIALAVATKIFAVLVAPFILLFYWRRWLIFFSVAIAVSFPLGLLDAWMPEGLTAMASTWLFNAPLYSLLLLAFPIEVVKPLLMLAFLGFWSYLFFRHIGQQNGYLQTNNIRGDYLFGVFFLCLPVVNAWYLVWLIPFAVLHSGVWVWVASISVLLFAYASGINLPGSEVALYQQPVYILYLEYGVILLAVLYELYSTRQKPAASS